LRLPPPLIENNENLPGSGNGNDVNLTGNRDHMYASDAEPVKTQTAKGLGEPISKRPTTTVTAHFITKPTGKKIIAIKGIEPVNFSQDQLKEIQTYISERMLKARSEATLQGKVPPTEISIKLPKSQLPNSPLPNSPLPNSPLPNSPLPNSPLPNSLLPNSQMPNSPLPNSQLPNSQIPNSQFGTKTQASTSIPNEKPIIQNQEISVRENMIISFYYILSKDREAYALFFESMGIQVSRQNLNHNPRITHVIARAHFDASNNTNFGAIVSGVWILDASYIQACMNANKILTNFSDFEFRRFFLTVKISEDLETLVGSKKATEYFVAKQMRTYIKENNLIDPTNRQLVICDDKLEKIIGQKKTKCCDMIKYLRPHMSKIHEFSM
jgi:hypothetical protein